MEEEWYWCKVHLVLTPGKSRCDLGFTHREVCTLDGPFSDPEPFMLGKKKPDVEIHIHHNLSSAEEYFGRGYSAGYADGRKKRKRRLMCNWKYASFGKGEDGKVTIEARDENNVEVFRKNCGNLEEAFREMYFYHIQRDIPEPPIGASVRFRRTGGGYYHADRFSWGGSGSPDDNDCWKLLGTGEMNAKWVTWRNIVDMAGDNEIKIYTWED